MDWRASRTGCFPGSEFLKHRGSDGFFPRRFSGTGLCAAHTARKTCSLNGWGLRNGETRRVLLGVVSQGALRQAQGERWGREGAAKNVGICRGGISETPKNIRSPKGISFGAFCGGGGIGK